MDTNLYGSLHAVNLILLESPLYRIYDISPPLSAETAVWPGDTPFKTNQQATIENGDPVTLSSFTTTAHIGAHADAPAHYGAGQPTIDKLDLQPFLGECLVVHAFTNDAITPEHARPALESGVARVLFRTRKNQDFRVFPNPFAYFHPDTLSLLGDAGIQLVGLDTPSVDPFSSKDLKAHSILLQYGMRNLEGLDLSDIAPGVYELIALPLRMTGMDGSPVRAVLRAKI